MKVILNILFVLLTSFSFSQKNIDSTTLYIPFKVGKSILIDLNELNRLKKQEELYLNEIGELEKKVLKNEKIIMKFEELDKKNTQIISLSESKYKLLDEENKNLRIDIKKIKTKNIIVEILSGSAIVGLTYVLVFK
jgi:hypothetical protein